MGWWSKVKGAVRVVTRVFIEAVHRGNPALGGIDTVLGFAAWPRKKLRLHIIILADNTGPVHYPDTMVAVSPADLIPALDYIKTVYKTQFNVEVLPYAKAFVEVTKTPAPHSVLKIDCGASGYGADFGEAGDFFAAHLAGWNAAPVSFTYPITVFVVQDVLGKKGCSHGPLTDYIVIDPEGVANPNLLAHEVGHSCGLWHSFTKSNLMWKQGDRGNTTKWFQRNLLRASRHVLYW